MDYWDKYFGTGNPVFQVSADDEEVEELRSEKSVKSGKSPEEIRKYSVDENLSDMERTCLLMSTGQSIQKLSVIENLPDLLKQKQMETLGRVIPKLCDMIPSSSVDVQVTASRVLGEMVQQELIPIHVFITSCLSTVLRQLENRDPAISRAWLGTLLASIAFLPKDELRRKIMTLAVAKGQLSQTVTSRQASCCILKEIAQRFDSVWLKREVLPLATALCQDVDKSVRELMCKQLFTLANALGREVSESCVLPELVELLNDEETQVRVCALEALTDLLTLWSQQCQRTQVIPLVQGFCEAATRADNWLLLVGVARLLGKICYSLKEVLTEDQFEWFLRLYCSLSTKRCTTSELQLSSGSISTGSKDVECRQQCAFNFPAMVLLVGKDAYKSKLASTFQALAHDSSPKIRRTVACGFHEVVGALEDRAALVAGTYQSLLKDHSEEVLSGLITHLPTALKSFAKAFDLAPETRHPGLLEFINPLLSCDQQASTFRQWRLHCELVKSFKCLVWCMTSDQIYVKFVPLMLKYITGDYVLPIRHAASYTLCMFLRFNRRLEQRKELIAWIIEECAKGQTCRRRLIFLEMCSSLLELFSRNFFKTHFFETVLQLSHDPVINIRLRLCQLFPALKALLKLPGDRVLLQNLEQTVRKLIAQDRDPDVAQAIRTAVTEMDRIEVAMETLSRKSYFESDLSDQQKEIEEKALVMAEEKDRTKMDKTLLSLKKVSGKAGKASSSPREVRKSSLTVLSPSTSHSPSVTHRSIPPKEKPSKPSPVSKTALSAPSSTVDLNSGSNSPGPSPSHAQKAKAIRKQPVPGSQEKSSPPMDKHRNTSSSSAGLNDVHSTSSKTAKSKDLIINSSTGKSTGGTTPVRKKPAQSYGLEYSNKGKRRTN